MRDAVWLLIVTIVCATATTITALIMGINGAVFQGFMTFLGGSVIVVVLKILNGKIQKRGE